MRLQIYALLLGLTATMATEGSMAQEAADNSRPSTPAFGSPDKVQNQIEKDASIEDSVLGTAPPQGWSDWKEGLKEDKGLSFTIDYSSALLTANESLNDNDDASSGMVRFMGSWDLFKRGETYNWTFIWKIEHRHSYTDVPPKGFALSELGYVGLVTPPFSDEGFRVTNLYWQQRFADGRGSWTAGFLDSTDFLNIYLMSSPWTGFLNFAFSTGSATIGLPNDGAIGIAASYFVSDDVYVIGSLVDTNSDPTDIGEGFNTFFGDNEYFTSIEIGFTTSPERVFLDNAHVTFWHKDRQEAANVAGGWGVAFSVSKYMTERWMPFIRGGFADDAGTLLERSVSVGMAYQAKPGRDLVGVAVNWGKPNEDTIAPDLSNQITVELFYRMQMTKGIALTGDVQWLKDPALNSTESSIWMFNLRARFNF